MNTQQNAPKNYTHEEKMLITQLAAAMYTPAQIQGLLAESAGRYSEMARLSVVEGDAISGEARTHIISEKLKFSQTMLAARKVRKKLEEEQEKFKKEHHLLAKIIAFANELKAPYYPEQK
ncbi:hypothetical protein K7Y63_004109 [Serratia marcescens]